jgi:hypothetical protein
VLGRTVCNFANFGRTNMIQVGIPLVSFSLDFPSSVFLVKMLSLVVVVVLAFF